MIGFVVVVVVLVVAFIAAFLASCAIVSGGTYQYDHDSTHDSEFESMEEEDV